MVGFFLRRLNLFAYANNILLTIKSVEAARCELRFLAAGMVAMLRLPI